MEILQYYARKRIHQKVKDTIKDLNHAGIDQDVLKNLFSLIENASISNFKRPRIGSTTQENSKKYTPVQKFIQEDKTQISSVETPKMKESSSDENINSKNLSINVRKYDGFSGLKSQSPPSNIIQDYKTQISSIETPALKESSSNNKLDENRNSKNISINVRKYDSFSGLNLVSKDSDKDVFNQSSIKESQTNTILNEEGTDKGLSSINLDTEIKSPSSDVKLEKYGNLNDIVIDFHKYDSFSSLNLLKIKMEKKIKESEQNKEESLNITNLMKLRSRSRSLSNPDQTSLERSEINRNLLTRLRITFLEVVRSAYWKQMEEGTLWRNSRTAMSLLYSIDVGLDSSHTPGHQDWDALKSSLEKIDFSWVFYLITPIDLIIRQIASCYNYIFPNASLVPTKLADLVSDFIEWNQDEFTIGVLTCFIAAHNYAQLKVPQYLGETEVDIKIITYHLSLITYHLFYSIL